MRILQSHAAWITLAAFGAVAMLSAVSGLFVDHGLISAKLAWFLFCIGVGLLVMAASTAQGKSAFGVLAFSLIFGGAAVLWLTEPLFFPSIRSRPEGGMDMVAFALIAAQLALGLFFLRPNLRALVSGTLRFGLFRVMVIVALGALLSVSVKKYLPYGNFGSYAKQISVQSVFLVVQLITVAAMMYVEPPRFLKIPTNRWIAASIAVAASALLAWLAIEFVPHVEDEVAYLFQARSLLGGHLTVPAPPAELAAGLDYYLLTISDGRWFAVTTPGWPAILTIGAALGQPWLLNPILAGASVLLVFSLVQVWTDRKTASITALLMAVSPWFLGSAATLMPHIAALLFTLVGWRMLVKNPLKVSHFLLAGLAMGVVFTIRQMEGVLIGTLTGVVLLVQLRQKGKWGLILAYSIGCIATGSLFLIYNAAMTGSALASPLQAYLDTLWHAGANSYGFGPNVGPSQRWGALDYAAGHSPIEGLVNTANNIFNVNFELFGWTAGSLLFVLVHLLFARQSRIDVLAWAIVVLFPLAHLAYWFSGSFYIGPRYWFAMLVPLCYLTARGILTLQHRAGLSWQKTQALVVVLAAFSLFVFVPWRGAEKYHGYGNYGGEFRRAAATGQFGTDVVVYEGPEDPGVALFLNDPYLPANKPIFVQKTESAVNPPKGRALTSWPE